MTNNAFLYIRAKCNAKQGESKLSELAAMTVGTGRMTGFVKLSVADQQS